VLAASEGQKEWVCCWENWVTIRAFTRFTPSQFLPAKKLLLTAGNELGNHFEEYNHCGITDDSLAIVSSTLSTTVILIPPVPQLTTASSSGDKMSERSNALKQLEVITK